MIIIKEQKIEEVIEVNSTVSEFGIAYQKEYFEEKYENKEKLIIVAYIDNKAVGYIVAYDKFEDGSFYCWMAGVNPKYRNKGVLKELMNYQNEWAIKKGYNKIKITTRNNRRAMLSYLLKYGFMFTEVTKNKIIDDNRIHLEKKI